MGNAGSNSKSHLHSHFLPSADFIFLNIMAFTGKDFLDAQWHHEAKVVFETVRKDRARIRQIGARELEVEAILSLGGLPSCFYPDPSALRAYQESSCPMDKAGTRLSSQRHFSLACWEDLNVYWLWLSAGTWDIPSPCSHDPSYFIHSGIKGCDLFGKIWGMLSGMVWVPSQFGAI